MVKKAVFFEDKSVPLQPGDVVILYTDGITEAQNAFDEFFGIERLTEIIAENHTKQPNKIIDSVLESVTEFCQSRPLQDDISMVVIKIM